MVLLGEEGGGAGVESDGEGDTDGAGDETLDEIFGVKDAGDVFFTGADGAENADFLSALEDGNVGDDGNHNGGNDKRDGNEGDEDGGNDVYNGFGGIHEGTDGVVVDDFIGVGLGIVVFIQDGDNLFFCVIIFRVDVNRRRSVEIGDTENAEILFIRGVNTVERSTGENV